MTAKQSAQPSIGRRHFVAAQRCRNLSRRPTLTQHRSGALICSRNLGLTPVGMRFA
jgi:hypothetical protein